MSDQPFLFSAGGTAAEMRDMPLQRVIDGYIRYYASGPGHTARAKRLDLKHFVEFLTHYRGYSRSDKLLVEDWDFSAVQRFVETLLGRGEAPATVSRRLATIKHMGRTLAEKVPGFTNPAKEVKAPKVNPPFPKALDMTEITNVRQRSEERVREKSSFIRKRNHCIFNFMIDTGLRADEVRLLRFCQVDDSLEWISAVRTKGRQFRNVYITSKMREQLREYLTLREMELKKFFAKLTKPQNDALPVFISTYKAVATKPESFCMGAKTLWRAINELSAEVHLHPHLLRHSYALDLLNDSNDVRLVAQALGHSDVRITMRYTERKEQEIASALERSRKKEG